MDNLDWLIYEAFNETFESSDFEMLQFINRLLSYHDLKHTDILFVENGDLIINPNLLLYILKTKTELFYFESLKNLKYDFFLMSNHKIHNDILYFDVEFYKNFIDVTEETLLHFSKPYTDDKNFNYFSVNDFKYFLKSIFTRFPTDKNIVNSICRFKAFTQLSKQALKKNNTKFIFTDSSLVFDNESLKCFLDDNYMDELLRKKDYGKQRTNQYEKVRSKVKRTGLKNEAYYQLKLYEKHKGELEVKTPVGNIDLLTKDKLFEIKSYESWKSAIGQLLSYGMFYPNHRKVMVLFNKMSNKDDVEIKKLCEQLEIDIVYI